MIHVDKSDTQVRGYVDDIMCEILIANVAVIIALEDNYSREEVIDNLTWYFKQLSEAIEEYISDKNINMEQVLVKIMSKHKEK